MTLRLSPSSSSPFDDVARCDGDALLAVAARLARNPSDASDLVQDAFERGLRRAPLLDPEDLRRWLIVVIRNLFLDCARRSRIEARVLKQLQHRPDLATSQPDDPSPASARVTREDLASALATLDRPFREVFELSAEGMPLSSVAALLGIPVATAGTRLHRARKKLRTALLAAMADRDAA
jgi:RNA polymerase sigma-70 factor (ECF subfamily)